MRWVVRYRAANGWEFVSKPIGGWLRAVQEARRHAERSRLTVTALESASLRVEGVALNAVLNENRHRAA